jgi:hypothetical protein
MKKIIAILLTLIFVFAVTSVTFAAEEKKAAPAAKADAKKEAAPAEKKDAKPAKKSAPKQATGEVAAVDAKANTITVKAKKGDVTVSVTDKTKFMPKGKTIADVKAGDKVTVKFTAADSKNTATSVEIKAAPAKSGNWTGAPPATKETPKADAPAALEKKAAPAAPAKKKSAGY